MAATLSIARKTQIGIVCAFAFISLVVVILYLHFSFFNTQLKHSADTTIPSLIQHTRLAQHSHWLQVQMEQALATDNPLILRRIAKRIRERSAHVQTIKTLRSVHKDPDLLNPLENDFATLQDHILTTIGLKEQMQLFQEQMQYRRDRLHILFERLSGHAFEQTELVRLSTQLISKTLSLAAEHERWIIEDIRQECRLIAGRGNRIKKRGTDQRLTALFNELVRLFEDISTSKEKEIALEDEFTRHKSSAVFRATNLVLSYNSLLETSGRQLTAAQNIVARRFTSMQHNTFFFLFMLILFFSSIYIFMHRRILVPVRTLNEAISKRTLQVRKGMEHIAPIPETGDMEIRKIAESTSYFIREIESQRTRLALSHAHLEKQVQERTLRIVTLSGKLIQAQEDERKRIARELHDDVGATMSVVKMSTEFMLKCLDANAILLPELHQSLNKQKALLQQMTTQLRILQTDLSPPYLDLGFIEALQVLCEDHNMLHDSIRFSYRLEAQGKDIPEHLHLVVYRIVQEGLTNIVKHSQATKARISLTLENRLLLLVIEDNGTPFPSAPLSPGRGLQNIEERVIVSNGNYSRVRTKEWKGLSMEWTIS